jgi:hypothetical protein
MICLYGRLQRVAVKASSLIGDFASSVELAGKASQMVEVVVKARFEYVAMDGRDRWAVKQGDVGIARLRSHRRYARFFEALVIWDADPNRKPRRSVLSSLVIVGIQTKGTRLIVFPLSKAHR